MAIVYSYAFCRGLSSHNLASVNEPWPPSEFQSEPPSESRSEPPSAEPLSAPQSESPSVNQSESPPLPRSDPPSVAQSKPLSVPRSELLQEPQSEPPSKQPNMSKGISGLNQADIDGIEAFVFFIGWPRSCGSVVGSMLDAHPNMIIAHEYYTFEKIRQIYNNRSKLFNELYMNSRNSAMSGWRSLKPNGKGYSLNIDAWQDHFSELKVIGDKCGGNTVHAYMKAGTRGKALYHQLKATVKIPIKVLQVVRNPFDMVATQTIYQSSYNRKKWIKNTHKYTNYKSLRREIDTFVEHTRGLDTMVHDLVLSPLYVYCEDLIAHPVETISNICQFLNLDCSTQYLQNCAENTFKNVSTTRNLVEWDTSGLELLQREIMQFPFFKRYI